MHVLITAGNSGWLWTVDSSCQANDDDELKVTRNQSIRPCSVTGSDCPPRDVLLQPEGLWVVQRGTL
jgi:hypothetical protein